jgi:hypothetical protein
MTNLLIKEDTAALITGGLAADFTLRGEHDHDDDF